MEPVEKSEVTPKGQPKGATYKIAARYEQLPALITVLNKRRINLAGSTLKIPHEPTPSDPRTEIIIPGATQADLAAFFAQGDQKIVIKV